MSNNYYLNLCIAIIKVLSSKILQPPPPLNFKFPLNLCPPKYDENIWKFSGSLRVLFNKTLLGPLP